MSKKAEESWEKKRGGVRDGRAHEKKKKKEKKRNGGDWSHRRGAAVEGAESPVCRSSIDLTLISCTKKRD